MTEVVAVTNDLLPAEVVRAWSPRAPVGLQAAAQVAGAIAEGAYDHHRGMGREGERAGSFVSGSTESEEAPRDAVVRLAA